jgi:NAD-dependent deacetylase
MSGTLDDLAARVRARIERCNSLCVLTGAGMSKESGIATFRDAQAMTAAGEGAGGDPGDAPLWTRFDPMWLATEEGFRANPALVWDWYAARRDNVLAAQPNAGHLALGHYAQRHPGRLTVVTQNVDDLHQRAGCTDTIRLHGDILADRWVDPCARTPECPGDGAEPGHPPRCTQCGNLRRPGVVWFGEMLPLDAMDNAMKAARRCEVLLVVGTSGAVWPAAGLAGLARKHGAFVAIVNPAASDIDHEAHLCIHGTAAGTLPALLDGL